MSVARLETDEGPAEVTPSTLPPTHARPRWLKPVLLGVLFVGTVLFMRRPTADTIFNTMAYQNPELDKAVDEAHYTTDRGLYERNAIRFIQLAFDDMPNVPLFQPYLNVAMQPNVSGYRYLFHRQLDYRHMAKT